MFVYRITLATETRPQRITREDQSGNTWLLRWNHAAEQYEWQNHGGRFAAQQRLGQRIGGTFSSLGEVLDSDAICPELREAITKEFL